MKRLQKTAVLLTAVILAGAFSSEDIKVEATSSTWQQIQKEQEEKNNLQNQLNEENDNLENLKGEQNSLKGQLNNLNGQLTEVSNNLSDLEQQIADKEQEIADTQASLEEAKATEAWQYECMVIRVRDMYERNETSYINALLNAQSFDKLLNAADFFERIAAYDQKKMQEFEENRKLIEEEEARLQAEKSKVSGLISQTSNSIAKYAGDISEAEQRALAYEQEIKQKEENLETLRKKLAEEIAMSQKAANATWRDISDISFEEGDRYLLANLIYCEAGGEPYDGQLAVASVVINRVRSSVYPNTVVGVIYQNKQFSPVASGRLELALATNKATSRCYQAADEAMSGVTNVGNCVYFRTPVEGLTGINIGGHVFY